MTAWRQEQILQLIADHQPVSRSTLIKKLGMNPNTASRFLGLLAAKKLIRREGLGRAAKWLTRETVGAPELANILTMWGRE